MDRLDYSMTQRMKLNTNYFIYFFFHGRLNKIKAFFFLFLFIKII